MPDDETPLHEADEADERDERMAALLAVEPLDDVTRRRLVNTAIRSTGSARQARRLIAAAAVVLVLVAGAGVVVAVGSRNDTSQTALNEAGRALQRAPTPYTIGTDARDVGNFGDLGVAAKARPTAARSTQPAAPASVAPRAPRLAPHGADHGDRTHPGGVRRAGRPPSRARVLGIGTARRHRRRARVGHPRRPPGDRRRPAELRRRPFVPRDRDRHVQGPPAVLNAARAVLNAPRVMRVTCRSRTPKARRANNTWERSSRTQKATRAVVYGLLVAFFVFVAVSMLGIAIFRVLVVLTGDVWLAYLILGGIFVIAGAFVWTLRFTRPEDSDA